MKYTFLVAAILLTFCAYAQENTMAIERPHIRIEPVFDALPQTPGVLITESSSVDESVVVAFLPKGVLLQVAYRMTLVTSDGEFLLKEDSVSNLSKQQVFRMEKSKLSQGENVFRFDAVVNGVQTRLVTSVFAGVPEPKREYSILSYPNMTQLIGVTNDLVLFVSGYGIISNFSWLVENHEVSFPEPSLHVIAFCYSGKCYTEVLPRGQVTTVVR